MFGSGFFFSYLRKSGIERHLKIQQQPHGLSLNKNDDDRKSDEQNFNMCAVHTISEKKIEVICVFNFLDGSIQRCRSCRVKCGALYRN